MPSNSTYVATLSAIIGILPLYINFVTVIAGPIGAICNLITYTAPQLRNNATVFYLLCATLFELLAIVFVVPTRIALDNFGFNLERRSVIFCKIRFYTAIAAPMLVTYYILFAIFDRCLATSRHAHIRSWSQLKVAHRLSLLVFIIGTIGSVHVLIFYSIYKNNCQVPPGTAYTVVFAVYLVFIVSLLPYPLMFILTLLTFWNLKQSRQHIVPTQTTVQGFRTKRSDVQLVVV